MLVACVNILVLMLMLASHRFIRRFLVLMLVLTLMLASYV